MHDVHDDPRRAAAEAFCRQLEKLDRGERAILKRNAGNTLAEARNAAWFYRELPDEGWKQPELYFLVATLYGHNPRTGRGNFGDAMRRLKQRCDTETTERRFRVLLDADFDREDGMPAGGELAFRLRQLVRLTASHEVGMDWPQLLLDLSDWGRPGKRVQKAWAKSFYAPELPEETETDMVNEEGAVHAR